ncbi:type VII secretion system-associated protein [Streptomyces sp. NPDC088387]|uniref:type VII secretion system-associated protein n=1 Tax=Streptomyces sp. NPDC088387 TaxID=3365859 RepID=UPI00380DF7E7
MPNLTKLDAAGLQAFIDGDLVPFLNRLKELRAPGQTPPSLFDVSTMPRPLLLGNMNSDSDTGGDNVVKNAKTAATAIDTVLNKHVSAFQDLELELRNVITTMLNTQNTSLTDIDGQKFLSAIDDYMFDLDGSGGGGNNSTES